MAAVFAAVCAGAGPQASPPGLSKEERDAVVRAHNAWRARVGVRPVRWSAELAAGAGKWATRLARRGCQLSHDPSTEDGENLFWAGPLKADGRQAAVSPITPTEVVDAWGGEAADYSYARNACAAGRRCGHYLQIVWAPTREVGCGTVTCGDQGLLWVCRYRPGLVGGKRPY